MNGAGFSRTVFSIVHATINLGLLAWALYLISYGWPLLHSDNVHVRTGGFTFVGGGLLLVTAAVVGIVFASSKLRRR